MNEFIDELNNNNDENDTGKSLLICEYLVDNLNRIYSDNELQNIIYVLSHGHGWKLSKYFKIIILRTEDSENNGSNQKLLKFIKSRVKSSYMKSAQQGDAPEPANNSITASQTFKPPAR